MENRVERRGAVGRPRPIHVRSVGQQQVEHGDVARAGRERERHAVARIGARVEQHLGERERADDEHRAPEHRPFHLVMPPGEAQVGIGAERDEPAGNRDQAGFATARSALRPTCSRRSATAPSRVGRRARVARRGPFGEVPLDRVGDRRATSAA